ncbi:unnamed protein product [Linum tenue]|uniref:Uncharacterized protein n=1 Tax=Linum tenue TaxID=586396 RepID=A0AAV0H3C0_9ROSI|nr:unnamed protein product [Linum tenue]
MSTFTLPSKKEAVKTEKAPAALGLILKLSKSTTLCLSLGFWVSFQRYHFNVILTYCLNSSLIPYFLEMLVMILLVRYISSARMLRIRQSRLADLADFKKVNEIYAKYFPAPFPARSTYQVAALPLNARIEIECIAELPQKIEAQPV